MANLRIEGLSKAFRDRGVLTGIDLTVRSGEFIAILGASGSGKTTLLRLIAGFERADTGTIDVDERQICAPHLHISPERRRIGYVAQDGVLFPHVSVGANVTFGLPWTSRRDRLKAETLLESVGLSASYATRFPHELSGGEQQRVALARALAPAPNIVLLDEPFSALDAAKRIETRQAVATALAEAGATAVLVTHDQSEALSMGQRIAVLREGKLAQVATSTALYRNPVDADLARFVGEAVVLQGMVEGGNVTCSLGRLSLAASTPNGPADVMVRPEQIRLALQSRPGATRARVLGVTYYGHDASVLLALAESAKTVTARVSGYAIPPSGAEVWLTVEEAVMAYPQRG